VAGDEVGKCVLDQRFAVVARLRQHGFVLDDVEVVDADGVALADEPDGLERAVADVNAPGETGGGHVVLLGGVIGGASLRRCSLIGSARR
jgi:hypothetical protein